MEHFDELMDFADGTLDAGREEELFFALSADEELRSEFKQMLAVRSAIQANPNYFTPPAESTLAVFSKVGLDYPGEGNNGDSPKGNPVKNFYNRYSQGIKGSLMTAFVAALLFFMLMSEDKVPDRTYMSYLGINDITMGSNIYGDSGSGMDYVGNTTGILTSTKKAGPASVLSTYTEKITEENTLADKPDNDIEPFNSINITADYNDTRSPVTQSHMAVGGIPQYGFDDDIEFPEAPSGPLNISAELNSYHYWHQHSMGENSNSSMLYNKSISLYAQLLDDTYIGIDIAGEDFFADYTTNNKDGFRERTVDYRNYTTIGLQVKQMIWHESEDQEIMPFVLVGIGGNSEGVVNRWAVGINYSPAENLSVNFGAYFGMMVFTRESQKSFNPLKYGLNYGIRYTF